jgi:hypothetical protein
VKRKPGSKGDRPALAPLPPLLNADAAIGFHARFRPDYPGPRELLAHLDRLGISRSLVWHTQARDLHPAVGNRRLLEDLADAGPLAERLIPTFVLAPSLLGEPNALAFVLEALRVGRVRGVRLFPGQLRHNASMVEPVLRAVARYRPAVFLDATDGMDFHAVADRLAPAFPGLPFVILHTMWGHHLPLFDLMRRHRNIAADISWMHTLGTIRAMTDEFGSGRLIFSIGHKSHNGAAIASLAHAGLGAAERERLAHRNLERFMRLPSTPVRPVPPPLNSLWARLLAGAPVSGATPLLDAHAHLGRRGVHPPPPSARAFPLLDAHAHLGPMGIWPGHTDSYPDQVRGALALMDRLGEQTMIVSGLDALFAHPVEGNHLLEQQAAPAQGRIRGYLGFNPTYADELTPLFDDFFSRPFFVGFKALCDYWNIPVTDPRFEPMLRYANRHRLPILYHTWSGSCDTPAMFDKLASRYPRAFFIMGHSGGVDAGREQAEALAEAHPNVILEWCGSFCSRLPWERTLARLGNRRVIFGSDAMLHDPVWELGSLLSLDVPEQTILPILGRNMLRILAARR